MRHTLLAVAAAALAGCQGFMDPQGGTVDRYVFESPEHAVLWVYRCLGEGRYEDMTLPMFEHADKSPWIARASRGNAHPWASDETAQARITERVEISEDVMRIGVAETWRGGERERDFVCRDTPDGWRIVSIEGEPGDGMLR